ncbi:hypothetical protein FHX09_006023 [Rhizobium sp. BK538]|nr:hypothetical protein [Rhizobium sp. BK538]
MRLDGQPWFVVADVRAILGIHQGGTNLLHLNEDEKQVIRKSSSTTFKGHGLAVISESGLYELIMRSDKPEAVSFKTGSPMKFSQLFVRTMTESPCSPCRGPQRGIELSRIWSSSEKKTSNHPRNSPAFVHKCSRA